MVISMALAALLLSAGFFLASCLCAAVMETAAKGYAYWITAWLGTGGMSLGFAFLAGNIWP